MTNLKKIRKNILIFSIITVTLSTSALFSMSIFEAIDQNNLELVKEIASRPEFVIDAVSKKYESPLFTACYHSNLEIVKYLIEKGADPSAPIIEGDYKGMTPLCIACEYNNLEIVEYLIQKGADPSAPIAEGKNEGITPLFIACHKGHLKIVEYLIEKQHIDFNAPIKSGNSQGYTPIHIACVTNRLEIVKYLIDKKGINFTAPLTSGRFLGEPPLFAACACNSLEVVKYLIEDKHVSFKKPITTGHNPGETPLFVACVTENLDIVKYLIEEKNIDFNTPFTEGRPQGRTPLQVACTNTKLYVVQYLLQKNAAIDQRSIQLAQRRFTEGKGEILKLINLTLEFNKIKNNKTSEVLTFTNSYKTDKDAYQFLVNFLFMESINELKNGRGIEATPFYDMYTYLTKQDLANPGTNLTLSKIFAFDKPGKFTGVYEFIKEAAKVNNLALDQNLITKLTLAEQMRKNQTLSRFTSRPRLIEIDQGNKQINKSDKKESKIITNLEKNHD